MLKILLFIDDLTSGGAQKQMVGLSKLLNDNNYHVKLIYYHPIEFYKSFLEVNGVQNECVEGARDGKKRVFKVAKAIKDFHPDVVISYLDVPNIIACFLKVIGFKYKLIVSERNTTQNISFRDRIKFFLMKWADYIVPNSYSQERFITNRYPFLKAKIRTITNFVDTDFYKPLEESSYKDNRIVVVGRVCEQKNVLSFLNVVDNIKKKGISFKVDWYGYHDEKYFVKCNEKIHELKIGDVFKFNSPTEDIKHEYQTCSVFCLPSIYEGFPNAICEAMSCGKPILCSNICDNSMIVDDGENGLLFDPLDVNDMSEKLIGFLLLSEHEKKQMGDNSRMKSIDKFSDSIFLEKYTNLIER